MKFPKSIGSMLLALITPIQFKIRLYWQIYILHKLKTLPSGVSAGIVPATINHNLSSLSSMPSRMRHLIKPLSAIELINPNARILVVGPRSEWDFFLLSNEGFRNVVGLDLITYSSFIKLGDMHDITKTFDLNSFDAILIGWTLTYSTSPGAVAKELLKVVKPGGIVGVAVEYFLDDPELDAKWLARDGYTLVDREKLPTRINSTKQIIDLFAGYVDHVYFDHDAPLRLAHHPDLPLLPLCSAVSVIFSVRK
jgi:hypothetical protein